MNLNSNDKRGVFQGSEQKKILRYSEDNFTRVHEGKKIKVILVNGSTFSGILKQVGMYDLRINDGAKELVIFKNAVATIEVL